MQVILLMGLQGAGKTTFFHKHLANTHEHISKDKFPNAPNRDKRQLRMLRDALHSGQSVVLDNTNVSRSSRAPLMQLAHSLNATVIGYYFQSQLKSCLERNAGREGKARVPDVAIYATAARLELPNYSEGFNQLFYVRLDNGCFEVLDWQDDEEAGTVNNHEQRPV